ncbi:hypothetical protein E2C01_030505 [Portunus trituberculatus]|uniref:Uncharacterized protein n=1 Tax=Portunus trituberculatus TaxID=210409 RepID=A0A5B7EVY0_PORTR|nr:hypothetical protein [Portunus trituberculatus]
MSLFKYSEDTKRTAHTLEIIRGEKRDRKEKTGDRDNEKGHVRKCLFIIKKCSRPTKILLCLNNSLESFRRVSQRRFLSVSMVLQEESRYVRGGEYE